MITQRDQNEFVEAQPLIGLWLKGLARGTRYNYTRAMIMYTEFCGMTPQELLDLKENGGLGAERLLDRFVAMAEGLSEPRKKIAVTAVHSFYKSNYLDLAARSGYSKVEYVSADNQRCPTQDELRKMVLNAHIRNDAIVNVISSGGFRAGTVLKLNWGDFHELWTWDGQTPIYVFVDSARLKGGGYRGTVEQHCFMTAHAAEVLLRYAEWYRSKRELTDESPLFISRGANQHIQSFQRMGKLALWTAVTSLGPYSPHDLRRYNQTQLEAARIDPNWIKKMQGKKRRGEDNPYSRPKIEQMRKLFNIAEPHLTMAPPRAQIDPMELRKKTILDSASLLFGDDKQKMFRLEQMLENVKTEPELTEMKEFWWSGGARQRARNYYDIQRTATEDPG